MCLAVCLSHGKQSTYQYQCLIVSIIFKKCRRLSCKKENMGVTQNKGDLGGRTMMSAFSFLYSHFDISIINTHHLFCPSLERKVFSLLSSPQPVCSFTVVYENYSSKTLFYLSGLKNNVRVTQWPPKFPSKTFYKSVEYYGFWVISCLADLFNRYLLSGY